jgi:hypothetical protein
MTRTIVALALFTSTLAAAQGGPAHRHLGFYLRLDAGLGGFDSELNTQDQSVHGGAGSFGVAIGGALTENLILAGHLFGLGSSNPDVTVGGASFTTSRTTVGLGGAGAELTYYFMPINLYLSGTLGFTRLYTTIDGNDSQSQLGAALELAVGKEWWVSPHWGLGVAGQLYLSGNKDNTSASSPTWGTGAFVIAFSATYN